MIELYSGTPGSGMTYPKEGRNANEWRAIAYFLAGVEVLANGGQAGQAQRRTAQGAGLQALPDGNHGDNRRLIK